MEQKRRWNLAIGRTCEPVKNSEILAIQVDCECDTLAAWPAQKRSAIKPHSIGHQIARRESAVGP
jgi:hypothetical protein